MHVAPLTLPLVLSVAEAAPKRSSRIQPAESDGELVRRARRGNQWAKEALYERHVRTVTRVVLRLLARTEDAEDAVQDAFIAAFSDLEKLRDEEAFKSWLLTIAVHQVHRRLRMRRWRGMFGFERGDDDVTLAAQADPRAGPDVRAGLAEIDRVLRTMPSRCHIAWVLRHVEGRELREVADACDCSLATAKRLIGRAERLIGTHIRIERYGAGDA